jgi:hypothetical protein
MAAEASASGRAPCLCGLAPAARGRGGASRSICTAITSFLRVPRLSAEKEGVGKFFKIKKIDVGMGRHTGADRFRGGWGVGGAGGSGREGDGTMPLLLADAVHLVAPHRRPGRSPAARRSPCT